MKKFSELSLYCKAGVVVAVTTAPIVVYKGVKLAYKWYNRKYRKIDVGKPEIDGEVIDTSNTDIEVNL